MDFNLTWTVTAVDTTAGTMVVKYECEQLPAIEYNLQFPPGDTALEEWVKKFAPTGAWERLVSPPAEPVAVTVGTTGQTVISSQLAAPAASNSAYNVSEEYLRALIFQVLDEIQNS